MDFFICPPWDLHIPLRMAYLTFRTTMGSPWLNPVRLSWTCMFAFCILSCFPSPQLLFPSYNNFLSLLRHFLSDIPQGWNVSPFLTPPSGLGSWGLFQKALCLFKLSSSLLSNNSSANCSLLACKLK